MILNFEDFLKHAKVDELFLTFETSDEKVLNGLPSAIPLNSRICLYRGSHRHKGEDFVSYEELIQADGRCMVPIMFRPTPFTMFIPFSDRAFPRLMDMMREYENRYGLKYTIDDFCPEKIEAFVEGIKAVSKDAPLSMVVGRTMQYSKGRANPKVVRQIIERVFGRPLLPSGGIRTLNEQLGPRSGLTGRDVIVSTHKSGGTGLDITPARQMFTGVVKPSQSFSDEFRELLWPGMKAVFDKFNETGKETHE